MSSIKRPWLDACRPLACIAQKELWGAYLRRMKSRLGTAKAIFAVAHKLARLVYSLLKSGAEYVAVGQQAYENQYQALKLKDLNKQALAMGFQLTPTISLPFCFLEELLGLARAICHTITNLLYYHSINTFSKY